MEHTTEENAVNPMLQELHEIVKAVKRDEEVALQYMKIAEREKFLHDQAIREGIAEGVTKGKIQAVDALAESLHLSLEEACRVLKVNMEEYRKIKNIQ